MEQVQQQITSIQSDVKALTKAMKKVLKTLEDPTGEKAKSRRENNSFNKPVPISDDLAKFLGIKDENPSASRSYVTRQINTYINEKSLKADHDRRIIVVDKTLQNLFDSSDDQVVTFLNMQSFLKRHYIKK